uniref:GIY-YIG domain-containing protein n=1 Tax=Phenylobacterium glaciei TaxID=2803784 RepID=A0A974P4F6_9CAUL|nr:hypothetical protein JKL49_05995 [Phenylobacterium glaciei]
MLLEDRRRSPPWGFYVGETSRDPDLRFDQHKTGYKASRYVNRFGVRLLPDVVEHLNPLRRWEAKELEAAVAEAFREAGLPWVEGGHWGPFSLAGEGGPAEQGRMRVDRPVRKSHRHPRACPEDP